MITDLLLIIVVLYIRLFNPMKLYKYGEIIHINPPMFDVIDDKPEGVARGVYHV